MRVIKKYNLFLESHKHNEATVYISNSEIKDSVWQILRCLREDIDDGFRFTIANFIESNDANQLNKGEGTEFVKVQIMKESQFDYDAIDDTIMTLRSFMESKGYNIWDYTCYLGHRPPTPKIERDLRRQYNRFGTGEWSESCYTFSIKFVKGDNSNSPYVELSAQKKWAIHYCPGGAKSTNEELFSSTYKSIADHNLRSGNVKKSEQAMKMYQIRKEEEEIQKKLEEERKKNKVIEDCAQLGTYKCRIRRKKDFVGDFYLNISFQDWSFEDAYPEFIHGDGPLYLTFDFGIIPASDESREFCEENMKGEMGGDKVTYWLGDFSLHLRNNLPLIYLGEWEEIPYPDDEGYFFIKGSEIEANTDCIYRDKTTKKYLRWNGQDWIDYSYLEYKKLFPEKANLDPKRQGGPGFFNAFECDFSLTTREDAEKFKSALYNIFTGNLYFRENDTYPGGLREIVATTLVEESDFSIEEFNKITQSISTTSLNRLYKSG